MPDGLLFTVGLEGVVEKGGGGNLSYRLQVFKRSIYVVKEYDTVSITIPFRFSPNSCCILLIKTFRLVIFLLSILVCFPLDPTRSLLCVICIYIVMCYKHFL